ncbi:hypothetical protein AcV5_000841 [Taiwanofungus camphoratus]|nr:hypothetical protein AcV5_000841 [Antrodia cinnamomea]
MKQNPSGLVSGRSRFTIFFYCANCQFLVRYTSGYWWLRTKGVLALRWPTIGRMVWTELTGGGIAFNLEATRTVKLIIYDKSNPLGEHTKFRTLIVANWDSKWMSQIGVLERGRSLHLWVS